MSFRDLRPGRLFILAALCAGLYVASGGCASAQPQINFKRIVNNWPSIELYYSMACDGRPIYPSDKRMYRVKENGLEVRAFDVWCADPYPKGPSSVSLVLDAGASMAGAGMFEGRMAAHGFIDLLDSLNDEAAVIAFAESSNTLVGMCPDKDLMHRKVQELTAVGPSHVWDGVHDGLNQLINNGVNPFRGVIVMTSGRDNGSVRTMAQVISLANRNRIQIFAIGCGNTVELDTLKRLSDLTGGRHFVHAGPSDLASIYWTLTHTYGQGEPVCVLTYQGSCPDGTTRNVELTLTDFCDGADTASRTYKAPLDSTARIPLNIGISEASTGPLTEVTLALQLLDANVAGTLGRARVHVRFDTSLLGIKDVAMPAGTLLDAVPFTIERAADGIVIQTLEQKVLDARTAPSTLAEVTFRTPAVSGNDTLVFPVQLAECTLESGCFVALAQDGEIRVSNSFPAPPRIHANGPAVFCDGGEVTLDAGAGYTAYSWSTGDSTQRVLVREAGTYIVSVRDSLSRTTTSVPFTVAIHPRPAPMLLANGPAMICDGDSLLLETEYGYASYEWSNGQSGRSIFVARSGAYAVTVRNEYGCAGTSDTLVTTLLPAPPLPGISQNGTILETDSAVGYQWYRNGVRIYGETGRTLLLQVPGSYTVSVSNVYGCSRQSAPFAVSTLAVDPLAAASRWSFVLYPDPATSSISLIASGDVTGTVRYTLLDLAGRILATKDLHFPQLHAPLHFDVGSYPPGMYLVVAASGRHILLRKFRKL
ncbi:MAG: VWA domain-containing protein [Ignavibacteria bacterium]|nr:VWA domain-containing protein [Ignavibacteria bacterium]